MAIRKLFRTGRTLAVSVPEGAAQAVGLAEGDFVQVEADADARALLIWPAEMAERLLPAAEWRAQVAAYLAAYGPALAALDAAANAGPAAPTD